VLVEFRSDEVIEWRTWLAVLSSGSELVKEDEERDEKDAENEGRDGRNLDSALRSSGLCTP
jgi:hypothetical protein